jgi:hypothetical protein
MMDFFSGEVGQSIPWFGLTHILLLVGFIGSVIALWIFGPKIGTSKNEKWFRYGLLFLVVLFEYKVFESRLMNGSIIRLPLCALSLYGLTFAIAFQNKKAYQIFYFYAFGTLLTYLFFDTVWGLDRWSGWTYFGAHATIGWLAVYGYRVLGYKLTTKELHESMFWLAIYSFLAGYATYKYGGSDELFLFHAPADFMNFLIDINSWLYLAVFVFLAALLMHAMYLPIYFQEKRNLNK